MLTEGLKAALFEFSKPALADLVDRHRIEVVQLFPAPLHSCDQVRLFEDAKMLADRLPRHDRQRGTKLAQGLAVVGTQAIQKILYGFRRPVL